MKKKLTNEKRTVERQDLMLDCESSSMMVSDDESYPLNSAQTLEKKLDSIVALLSTIVVSQKQHDDRL